MYKPDNNGAVSHHIGLHTDPDAHKRAQKHTRIKDGSLILFNDICIELETCIYLRNILSSNSEC